MNYRINMRIVAVVSFFALIAVGVFIYTVVSTPTIEKTEEAPAVTQEVPERLISAKHQYKEGTHTIAGKVSVPTPCHRLQWEPFLLDNNTVVEIRFATLMQGEECPSQEYEVPFRVTFDAVENVTIRATWDGVPARLNLIPIGPDETLDDELYIKG